VSASAVPRDPSGDRKRILDEVLTGLEQPQKHIPCKYLYDERGSRLFERICELEEYYPTRTELGIMESNAADMARELGAGCLLVEYGSGSSRKTRLLLDHMERPAAYVPIDISRETLHRSARALATAYPHLEVLPVCADYTEPVEIPESRRAPLRRGVYFPGSTIGNFTPADATAFLCRMAGLAGARGGMLIGVDLKKDSRVLELAYDDPRGVTAAFNKNLLARLNRELDADFPLERFRHRAVYDANAGRVEMHLVCDAALTVSVGDVEVRFEAGETIHTENSYKYELDEFAELAQRAGLAVRRVWTDGERRFSVQLLAAR
jgi:L-histidine Nalpha-methyltransferase